MANTVSAIKRLKQSEKRRVRNVANKSKMKTEIKGYIALLEQKNLSEASEALKNVVRSINKTASKGVIAKNNASRKVSRLTTKLNKAKAAE